MSRLEEIKDEYSIGNTGINWTEFEVKTISNSKTYGEAVSKIELHLDQISKLYATECIKASLEKASENACIEPKGMMTRVDKESITNESNIILL